MTSEWATVVVVAEAEELELAVGLLWDAGVSGIEEIVQPDGRVELRAGCEADRVDAVRRLLTERWSVSVETTAADAGLDAWRDHASAWRAGARIVVVPAWQPPPEWVTGSDLVLVVDPDRSFGSGSHPTTRLCLAAVERLVRPGAVVADVGCGSGVLAIAAARLGAVAVHAVDVEPDAVEATARNAARNGVATIVHASDAALPALAAGSFDVVVANIGAGVLRSLAPAMVALLAPTGVLVLSGVLDDQVDEVRATYAECGCDLVGVDADGDWRVLELRISGRAD